MMIFNSQLMLFISLMILSNMVHSQSSTDYFLTFDITSNEFADGIAPGESGSVSIRISNQGPSAFSGEKSIAIGHNYTQNFAVLYEFLTSTSADPNCQIHLPHVDPRPPVDDIVFMHYFTIEATIAAGETYTCVFNTTFTEPGLMETVWRMSNLTINGWVTQEVSFVFRGQAMAVPLHLSGFLLLGMLLLAIGFLRPRVAR